MANNTEDVELLNKVRYIIGSTYSNGSISDSLPGGLQKKFKDEQSDKIALLIQQEANRQKLELLDRVEANLHNYAPHRTKEAIQAERKQLEEAE